MTNFTGKFFKVANGHESYEIEAAEPVLLFPVATKIQEKYGFESPQLPLFGLDVTYLDIARDNVKITMGWDNWSGLFIFAFDEEGDAIIREIGRYLDSIIKDLFQLQEELLAKKEE